MFGQSHVQASGRSKDDAVGNSLGVHWELIEGIGSLLGWCKGVRRKKTENCQKIIEGSRKTCQLLGRSHMDPGSCLSIEPRFGQCDGSSSGVR
ncbi:hypothetical protein B296_00048316 [Ensete ventricosum]|uniref:Uncharacterized protein n=1 Tax=Ensete ventricosum TaxID=4639 RepID=A0A426Y805_ENSVE|nr:hypothetical protein B296_00048316 [Ensete ventricosum]